MNTRLVELLPWYLNGTISAEDRAWVEQHLHDDPQAMAQLRWYQALQAQIRQTAPQVSDEIGLDQALARIRADRRGAERAAQPMARSDNAARRPDPQGAAAGRRRAPRSLIERFGDWIGSVNPVPALTAAGVLVLAQGVVIGVLVGQGDTAGVEYRSMPAAGAEPGPLLKVNFKPDARESDIRLLLVEVQGSLAGGPGQLGDWFVRVAPARLDEAAAILKASPIVDDVATIDALPARP